MAKKPRRTESALLLLERVASMIREARERREDVVFYASQSLAQEILDWDRAQPVYTPDGAKVVPVYLDGRATTTDARKDGGGR